jgi:hypothetical protein
VSKGLCSHPESLRPTTRMNRSAVWNMSCDRESAVAPTGRWSSTARCFRTPTNPAIQSEKFTPEVVQF